MREFVAASGSLSFTGADREEIYGFVEGTWQARQYLRLSKKDKGVVRRYLATISGRSLAQITRLIRRYRQSGSVDTVTQWQVVGCCETITISFLMSAPPTLVPAPNHGDQSDWERHPQPRVTSRRSATVTLILYSLPNSLSSTAGLRRHFPMRLLETRKVLIRCVQGNPL